MNIYLRELRAHLKSLMIWCGGMIFLIVAGMGKYSAASGTAGGFNELMDKMPKSLQNLFGVGVFDLSNALDYFGMLFIYLAIVAAAHAAMLGAGIISKEERDKTAEFLMVKPVSRQKILTSKLLSALTMIVIMNIVSTVSSFGIVSYFASDSTYTTGLTKLMAALFALQIIFGSIGAFLACVIKYPKLSAGAATGILMLMFILSIAADISGIKVLRYFALFQYFDAREILKGGYQIGYPIFTFLLSAALVITGYFFYQKRDFKV